MLVHKKLFWNFSNFFFPIVYKYPRDKAAYNGLAVYISSCPQLKNKINNVLACRVCGHGVKFYSSQGFIVIVRIFQVFLTSLTCFFFMELWMLLAKMCYLLL